LVRTKKSKWEEGRFNIIHTDGEQYEADEWKSWKEDFGFHTSKTKKKRKQGTP